MNTPDQPTIDALNHAIQMEVARAETALASLSSSELGQKIRSGENCQWHHALSFDASALTRAAAEVTRALQTLIVLGELRDVATRGTR